MSDHEQKVEQAKARTFERRANEFRERLDEEADSDFKIAVFQALQHMEQFAHGNNLIALSLLENAVTCYLEGQDDQARILMYVSGATVNADVAKTLLVAIRTLTTPPET